MHGRTNWLEGAVTVPSVPTSSNDMTPPQAAESDYRSIVEQAVDGIFRTSPDGRLLFANPALARILGYASPQELLDQVSDVARQLHVDVARRTELVDTVSQHDTVTGFTAQVRRKDGSTVWLSFSVRALRHPDGTVREFEGIAEDISERQEAEEAIRQSEARYRTLVDNFPNGSVFLFDRDLRYTVAGGTGLAASGLAPEMFVGKTIWEIFPPEVAARDEPALRAALQGEATWVEVPFGATTYLVHTLPVIDASGTVVGGIVMTQDITDRKRAEEQLQFLAEASARLGASLDFTATLQSIARLAIPLL